MIQSRKRLNGKYTFMTVKEEIEDYLIMAYKTWLMENYADEIHTSDNLIQYSQDRVYFDEFLNYIKEVM